MDKLTNFLSTVRDSEVVKQEVTSGAGDKIVKCLAVIGLFATAKTVWQPLRNYVLGNKTAENEVKEEKKEDGETVNSGKPKSQKSAHLKERYGGDWAIIMESTADKTTKQLALELAREGYNLIFIMKKDGPERRIVASTSKYGVKVEFLTSEHLIKPGQVFEECFKDKDISIIASGITQDLKDNEQQVFLNTFNSQIFMSAVLLPCLLSHHEKTNKLGALIHILVQPS